MTDEMLAQFIEAIGAQKHYPCLCHDWVWAAANGPGEPTFRFGAWHDEACEAGRMALGEWWAAVTTLTLEARAQRRTR